MYSGRRIAFLRIVSLGAAGASAALTGDGLQPGRAFCPLEEACEKARHSALGSVLGVPTSVVGMAAFGALFLLTLLPVESSRRVLRPAGVLAAMVGALLLGWQAFVIEAFCPLCLVADAAGLLAGVLVATWPPLPIRFSGRRLWGESGRSRVAWSAVATLAVLAPLLWPRPEAPSWIELPEADVFAIEDHLAIDPPSATRDEALLAVHDAGDPAGSGADLATPGTVGAARDLPRAEDPPVEAAMPPTPPTARPPVRRSRPARSAGARASSEATPEAAPEAAPEVGPPARPAALPPTTTPAAPAPPAQATRAAQAPTPPTAPSPQAAHAPPRAPDQPAPQAARPDVVIVEYLNAYCAHCRATHRRLEQVVREMGLNVRRHRIYTWSSKSKEYPLWARACAYAETVGLEDRMFEELLSARGESAKDVQAAAQRAGLDLRALQAALADPTPPPRLLRDRRLAASARLQGLPTLDIGRRRLMGDQSEAELRQALKAATTN